MILTILRDSNDPVKDILKLYNSGKLNDLFPELVDLNKTDNGHKNNFLHTLGVLQNVCDAGLDFKQKIVALFHDIGKNKTKRKVNGKWTFYHHENVGAIMSKKILKDWNLDNDTIDYVYRMIKYHGRTKMHRDVSESAIRRLTKEVGADIINDLIDFCKCDLTSKFENKRNRIISSLNTIKERIKEVQEKDEDAKWRSPLTGHIVMELLNIQTSPLIGEIKKKYDPLLKNDEITLDDAIKEITNEYKKSP
jgi:poly(A) polymerase